MSSKFIPPSGGKVITPESIKVKKFQKRLYELSNGLKGLLSEAEKEGISLSHMQALDLYSKKCNALCIKFSQNHILQTMKKDEDKDGF